MPSALNEPRTFALMRQAAKATAPEPVSKGSKTAAGAKAKAVAKRPRYSRSGKGIGFKQQRHTPTSVDGNLRVENAVLTARVAHLEDHNAKLFKKCEDLHAIIEQQQKLILSKHQQLADTESRLFCISQIVAAPL